ncbi:MAG: ferredoxin [Candidatus Omnitrophica bacterium CG11_big_fil_rev_8_21_14_0_20_63_9]|nr:MAG: ferredoxin [Candidatus Omnitrophica bacterium CG11_big_fil_rev_8_21_14_0_20_63_9]
MHTGRVPYQKILFVCINKRAPSEVCCSQRDSEAVAEALKARVKALGLSRHVRVSKSGCQDLCAKGPNVMVFPDYVCYDGVTLDDVERIIQDAIRGTQSSPAASNPAPT